MPKSFPPEFRRKVLDLVAAGRPVAQVAADLDISDQSIYGWRRQHLIDTGQMPGLTSGEQAELVAARKRIRNRNPAPRLVIHSDHGAGVHLLGVHPASPRLRAGALDGLGRGLLRHSVHDHCCGCRITGLTRVTTGGRGGSNPSYDWRGCSADALICRPAGPTPTPLEIFHNRQRRHSTLGMRTPIEYELRSDRINSVA